MKQNTVTELHVLLHAVHSAVLGKCHKTDYAHDSLDNAKLTHLSRRHGLIGFLQPYCMAVEYGDQPLCSQLKNVYIKQAFTDQILQNQIACLSASLSAASIKHAFLKGPLAVKQFYHTNCIRPSADIDLLIAPTDFETALPVLHKSNYQLKSGHDSTLLAAFISCFYDNIFERDIALVTTTKQNKDIDLHWRVAHAFSLPLSTQAALDQIEYFDVQGKQVPTLAFDDHFILLCVHGYLDTFFTLKHLADLFFAINHSAFAPSRVLANAEVYGVRRHVVESIAAANFFFRDLARPDSPELKLSFVRKLYKRFIQYDGAPPRIQTSKASWSIADKTFYICQQIKTRSQKSHVLAPLLHRRQLHLGKVDNQTLAIMLKRGEA